MAHQLFLVMDFGSQYTKLIARRLREAGVYSKIVRGDTPISTIKGMSPRALVLSGGPASVTDANAILPGEGIFHMGIPILGVCYGMQLMAHMLGGRVVPGGARREYGAAELEVLLEDPLFTGTPKVQQVWMSHGDVVEELPPGFSLMASTRSVKNAAAGDLQKRFFALQFHPEVKHTTYGKRIIDNFLSICGALRDWSPQAVVTELVNKLRERVESGSVVCGVSGGVDSTVTAVLLWRALGDRVKPIFVDTGLLRAGEPGEVTSLFRKLGIPLTVVDAAPRFFAALAGVEDPEEKRRLIGHEFIKVFEDAARSVPDARYLAQGTLYPDVIESSGVLGTAQVIKTHHNVGGLPERLGLELVEPLRELFKDEVKAVGRELGIPEHALERHPFPGPGLAVRVVGEVTPERVARLRAADRIFVEELKNAGLYRRVSQALCVLLPTRSVGVMGDRRTYHEVVVLRAIQTEDFMTADWARLPHQLLDRVARRIVNEVDGVNRVLYDVTTKPPATIEWE